ncbi:MAG: PIN domain-containing protein [Gemmatimonas sp.]|nr:PIN domain-containing protein [Gemmatimonas sp.]
MRIFLDTDVLLDVALDREPHAASASALLDLLERRVGTGHIAWHTISNVFYLIAKDKTKERAKLFIGELLRFVQIAPVSTELLQRALKLPVSDFEDAMQVVCAEACDADVIATRNVMDYRRSPIRPMTPAKLLGQLRDSD